MNILLDECTPRIVKKRLPRRAISTVQEMGWAGVRNGELLTAAEAQFDVFITADKKLIKICAINRISKAGSSQ